MNPCPCLTLTWSVTPSLCSIFTVKPEYQDFFPTFRGMSLEDVASSPKMRAHGSIFMNALASIVDNLDDIECAAEIMRKKVQSHWSRGMRTVHYEV